jgi:hypothetical protein
MSHYQAFKSGRRIYSALADRASITMEGAVCAKREYGTTAPDLGHQQFAPTKIIFGHLARSPQKANRGNGKHVCMLNPAIRESRK